MDDQDGSILGTIHSCTFHLTIEIKELHMGTVFSFLWSHASVANLLVGAVVGQVPAVGKFLVAKMTTAKTAATTAVAAGVA